MPRAISPGPAGLKFWRAPGLAGEIVDIYSLPAGIGDQFNPWGPKRPVQDWAWGNPCLYPPALLADTDNLPAGMTGGYVPWGRPHPIILRTSAGRVLAAAAPFTLTADGGSYSVTGTAAASAFGQVAGSSSYSITGSAAALALRHVAGAGSYTITGSAAALALRHTAGAGSYSLTGIAAGLTVAVNYVAAAGSYTLTGSAATFAFGQVGGAGSYTITGTAAGLVIPGGLTAGAGSYALTGSAATIGAGTIDYAPGWTRWFNPWGPRRGREYWIWSVAYLDVGGAVTLTADAGSYGQTGTDAGLTVTATGLLPTGATSWFNPWGRPHPVNLRTLTGRPLAEAPAPEPPTHLPAGATNWFNPWGRRFPINLRTSTGRPLAIGPVTLPADAGSYIITGLSAALALRLTANSGSYTVSGTDAQLVQVGTITLTCGAGAYLISGSDAALTVSITPPAVTPPAGGVGVRVGPYKTFKLKKKRKHDQCEELLEYLRSLPPVEAEAAVAELPPSYLSLLDGLPLPHALVLPPASAGAGAIDEDDDDECALLLEMLLR